MSNEEFASEQRREKAKELQDLKSEMGATAHELTKLNTFWLKKYTQLHETVTKIAHSLSVAIGVRNNKIAELKNDIKYIRDKESWVELELAATQKQIVTLGDKAFERIATLEQRVTNLEERLLQGWQKLKEEEK